MPKQSFGFTIVELLTVIAVIGILATITTYGFITITRDSRDTERRTGTEAIASALQEWARDNSKTPIQTSAGYNGTGEGWVRGSSTGYTTNIETVLLNGKFLKKALTAPNPTSGTNGFAVFACNSASSSEDRYGVFAKLESPKDTDAATTAEWTGSSCTSAPLGSPYSSNYVHIFRFRQ